MTHVPANVIPMRFDLSELVQRSVATLYSHLVTRPTGRALRIGIESQITELGTLCVSVLDFQQVIVLDYSCADETVAKLLQRFQASDRPADVYFVARGVSERHRDPIESVLRRHSLNLVAEVEGEGVTLLGDCSDLEFEAWTALENMKRGHTTELCCAVDSDGQRDVNGAVENLIERRVFACSRDSGMLYSLSSLLNA